MSNAFLDTTVLADLLLKGNERRREVVGALTRFSRKLLPVYAIKELKQGALKNVAWLHNKVVQTESYETTIKALHAMSRTLRRNTTSTAIEALAVAQDSIGRKTLADLQQKYGAAATADAVMADELRLTLKATILKAWRNRRAVADEVVNPLSCYEEVAPRVDGRLLVLEPTDCPRGIECCMSAALKAQPDMLRKLRDVSLVQGGRTEPERRAKALRQLYRTPRRLADRDVCRSLGDAIFAFFAPSDSVIVTTNLKDHEPLAGALKKVAERV